jgi:Zn-dependent peptidase ImmA (M78 family)/transcriptional regulator with XRE-family HTH domain
LKILNLHDSDNIKLIPLRIREARVSRGYSLFDLAEEINVSKQLVSKYELGTVKVPAENLVKISQLLEFPLSFFYKYKDPEINNYSESVTFFRSLRSTSKKTKISLEQNIDFVQEIFLFLKKYIDFPPVDIPENIAEDYKTGVSDEYIEEMAMKLRQYWNLGNKPIKNLSNLLLKKGFVISRVELNTEKVDAFSKLTSSGIPCVILGSDKNSAVRSRMDLAHELGHIILHSHIEETEFEKNLKKIEKEATKFAGSFLLPAVSFSEDIHSVALDSFIYLKEKWKVSIAAMVVRTHSLQLISDEQYNSLFRQINAKNWRRKEPLDDSIDFERPNMINEALELLVNNNILTLEEFIDNICFNEKDIENLCFLPIGYFKSNIYKNNKPQLKIIK